jgi:hypothetical protein
MFWLLTMSGNSSYYIDSHIVSLRRFSCCHNIKINRFGSKDVLYLNLFRTLSKFMLCIKTNYIGITNMYSSLFNKLGFSFYYKLCRFNYGNWFNQYFFFLLWQVSNEWHVLLQLVQVNVDLVITNIIRLTHVLVTSVVTQINMSIFFTYYNNFLVFNQGISLHTYSC